MISSLKSGLNPTYFSRMNPNLSPVIGIDLGTTNSCVSIVEGGTPKVLTNSEGARTTPSIVAFDKTGNFLIGEHAKRQAITNTKGTFSSTKRLIGRQFNDETVSVCQKMVPYDIVQAPNGEAWVKDPKGQIYSPAQIGALVLSKMKETAESYLGYRVKDAVITVPAYFNNMQRQATKDAGKIAGLNVMRTINEPTAAALAYGIDRQRGQTVAVYDLGGGTFDISILEISNDGVFEVKATNGDTFLGGEDFDSVLLKHVIQQYLQLEKIDLSQDPMAVQRIKEAVEKAKCELSSSLSTEINLPYIYSNVAGPKHLHMPITRNEFEGLTNHLIEKTTIPCASCLKDAGYSPKDINEVILVGGMTRVPKVIDTVREFFGRDPFRGVNPDEVVAIGASIQGSVLSGGLNEILLLDVTPLSLGIETMGGLFSKLIPRNTVVPTKRSEVFSTGADGQTSVSIRVFQGEREVVSGNKLLGEFTLEGIPPSPKGIPQIEVSFEIDANSIVHVSAIDKNSGAAHKMSIRQVGGLSQEEILKMIGDAEKNSMDDKKKREIIEQTYDIHGFIEEIEKQLHENDKRLPQKYVMEIKALVESMKNAIKTLDVEVINKAFSTLRSQALLMSQQLITK